MATEYISREAAINTQERRCLGCPVDRRLCYKCAVTTTTKQLLELPAADVRPVVLCRDCRWWMKQEKSLQGRCELAGFYPTGEWFCANGEKR